MSLTTDEKNQVAQQFARYLSYDSSPCMIRRSDIIPAITGLDDWIDTKQTEINQAFPVGSRSGLSIEAKSVLLQLVINKKYGGL